MVHLGAFGDVFVLHHTNMVQNEHVPKCTRYPCRLGG